MIKGSTPPILKNHVPHPQNANRLSAIGKIFLAGHIMNNVAIKKYKSGFTLIELLVTLAVAIILLSVVVPSFSWLIESSKERSTRDLIVSSIFAAQQQAQSRLVSVNLCATTDATTCVSTWGSDWLVYEDNDGSGTMTAGDVIISNVSSKTDKIDSTSTQIVFSPTGHSTLNTFKVCSNTDNAVAYQIELSRMGRIGYTDAAGGC